MTESQCVQAMKRIALLMLRNEACQRSICDYWLGADNFFGSRTWFKASPD